MVKLTYLRLLAACAAVAATIPAAANASVTYIFTATDSPFLASGSFYETHSLTGEFSYTVPTYLTGASNIVPVSALNYCTVSAGQSCGPEVSLYTSALGSTVGMTFSTTYSGGGGAAYFFGTGAFQANGFYNSLVPGSAGTLQVSGSSDPTPTAPAVPEPATWAMMLLGFGGIGMAMRRKRKPVLATA